MIRTSLLISALLSASIAYAADGNVVLSGQKGTVMVNSGKQFVSAQHGQTLAPGDRVMVMSGGKATLTYPNGCVATVPSGTMVDVSKQCGQSTAEAHKVGAMYAQAIGDQDDNDSCNENRDENRNANSDDNHHRCIAVVLTGYAVWTAGILALIFDNHHRHEEAPISVP